MTKGLGPALLRKYKKHWETTVAQKRRLITLPPRTPTEETSRIRFEIKRATFSLPGAKAKKEFDAITEYLFLWHIMEGATVHIVKSINLIHWWFGPDQVTRIATLLYEFVFHFIGPNKVPMVKSDEKLVLSVAESLGSLGFQSGVMGFSPPVVRSVCSNLYKIAEIGRWYRKKKIAKAVMKELKSAEKEWAEPSPQASARDVRAALGAIQTTMRKIQALNRTP